MNTLFIAIDAGKDSTKFVYNNGFNLQRDMFRTKVQKIDNLGVDVEHNTFKVEFNNESYLIGDMVSDSKLNFDLSKKSISLNLIPATSSNATVSQSPTSPTFLVDIL